MKIDNHIRYLENLMNDLSFYENKGLDTSSLRLFIKNLKTFQKIQKIQEFKVSQSLSFAEKLNIIKSFLEDKKIFHNIKRVIDFANKELDLGFRDQKESRKTTIRRVIGKIEETPELKEKVKLAVLKIRNQKMHYISKKRTKKEIESAESYAKWAEILRNL